jgi:hypothetical protein
MKGKVERKLKHPRGICMEERVGMAGLRAEIRTLYSPSMKYDFFI